MAQVTADDAADDQPAARVLTSHNKPMNLPVAFGARTLSAWRYVAPGVGRDMSVSGIVEQED